MLYKILVAALAIALVAVFSLWRVDHQNSANQINALSSQPPETNLDQRLTYPEWLAVTRWADRAQIHRIASRFYDFKNSVQRDDFSSFEESLKFELVHAVTEAFAADATITELDLSPDPIYDSKTIMEYLKCSDKNAFFDLSKDVGIDGQVYTYFDPSNPKHQRFNEYLDRVFAE